MAVEPEAGDRVGVTEVGHQRLGLVARGRQLVGRGLDGVGLAVEEQQASAVLGQPGRDGTAGSWNVRYDTDLSLAGRRDDLTGVARPPVW